MTGFLLRLNSWLILIGILGAAILLGLAWQVVRYLWKRGKLYAVLMWDSRRGLINLRPRRPLWWLFGRRCDVDVYLDLKHPETGEVTHTLAVKLIPTLARGREYSVGDMDRWETKLNFLMPLPNGVIKLDFGYRRCMSRPVERVFRHAPFSAVKVYLFHPHPHALTLGRRGSGRGRKYRSPAEVAVLPPMVWLEGVLLTDLANLRGLAGAEAEGRERVLCPPSVQGG